MVPGFTDLDAPCNVAVVKARRYVDGDLGEVE